MTITKIAKMAGTSIATVSRVINNDPRVRDETRARIQGIINETGFVPNSSARNLRTNVSNRILTILPTIATPAYAELISGVTRKANEYDYSVMFMVTDRDRESEAKYLRLLETKTFDGVILVATTLDDSVIADASKSHPVISCNSKLPNQSACYVSIDNREAAYNTTKHLLGLGHRRILPIKYCTTIKNQLEREEGYKDAMREAGLTHFMNDALLDNTDIPLIEQLEATLKGPNPPTAVLSFGDTSAQAVLRFAKANGMELGRDLDLIGFGNVASLAYGMASITVVSIPWFEIGEIAFELAYEQIVNPGIGPRGIILPYNFVLGDTTRLPGEKLKPDVEK